MSDQNINKQAQEFGFDQDFVTTLKNTTQSVLKKYRGFIPHRFLQNRAIHAVYDGQKQS